MASTSSSQTDLDTSVEEVLARRTDTSDHRAMLIELREQVKAYEARFGMSSDRIHEAIDAGELIEDLEVVDWIFTVELLRGVEPE